MISIESGRGSDREWSSLDFRWLDARNLPWWQRFRQG